MISGNLPFSANHEAIKKHFLSLDPISIRHPKNRITGKSKGFAFLEFAGFDRMKTCLKIYHHSIFDDGDSPPRKINVELTYSPLLSFDVSSKLISFIYSVGGGGSSSIRKSRLRAKNEKLNQERKNRTFKDKVAPNSQLLHVGESHRIHPSRQAMIKK